MMSGYVRQRFSGCRDAYLPMIWKTKNREFDLTRQGLIMGILNVTGDSFSDGGKFLDPDAAAEHALRLEAEGADIIDVGGESTRPGADPVPEEEELARVIPVVKRLKGRLKAAISIDTRKAAVARAALDLGAEIVNDVTALRGDPAMASVVAESGAGVVLMHMRGEPQTMQAAPHYEDVVAEVREFFRQTLQETVASGVSPLHIAFDPGIGFGKTVQHNLALVRSLGELSVDGRPLVLGVSRKSFLSKITHDMTLENRLWPTLALTSVGRERGARVFRVHDVKPNLEALRMTEAVVNS